MVKIEILGKGKQRKSLRRKNRHPLATAIIAIVVAVGVLIYIVAPYIAGPPFQCITGESYTHVHPYLRIVVLGKNVTVPQGIGILPNGCFEPIHTHDSSGILHVELSAADAAGHNFTLRDFFTIWKYTANHVPSATPKLNNISLPVVFDSNDIFGFRTNSTYKVELIVDGNPSVMGPSLNLEQMAYCSSSSSGSPCYPTACNAPTACGNAFWKGSSNDYPFGYGHTIVIDYVRV